MARRKLKALIAWSSGKDSAWALHEIRKDGSYDIVGALTTVTEGRDRVTVHGVREDLLRAQLDMAALSSILIRIPDPCPAEVYERAMGDAVAQAKAAGVTHIVFGDLFLADLRAWREARLSDAGITAVFPLWQRPTDKLARDMIAAGMRAYLATVDLKKLPQSFAGRSFDDSLLAELPSDIDPCGENGEFHSFAAAGPMFAKPVAVTVGETSLRDGFAYADLIQA